MIASRFKSIFFASLALLLLPAHAQQRHDSALGNEAFAKQRAARFLSERGIPILPGSSPRYHQSPTQMLAQARARFHRASPLATGPTAQVAVWQPVGPAQVFTSAYGYVAGPVTSIAADPSDPTGNTVYIGTAYGGVWKSTNAASIPSSVTFVPLTDDVYSSLPHAISSPSLSIGAVSVQPVSPGNIPVILAGTGVPNDTTASYFGSGILRSTDGGSHWTLISQTSDLWVGRTTNFNLTGMGVAGFAWGSVSGNPVVVAALSQPEQGVEVKAGDPEHSILGLYYSTDLGQTWLMATITDPGGLVQSPETDFAPCDSMADRLPCGNAVTSVVWNPVRNEFVAAVRFHGYYVSSDGQNWTRLASQPGTGLTTLMCPPNNGYSGSQACPIYNGVLAVQPVTGDTFALTTDRNNFDQGLWRDTCSLASGSCASSTVSFAQISDSALDCGATNAPNCAPGNAQPTLIPQADYDLYLAAVPYQNDTLLFVGTADIYRCDLGQGCVWRNTTHAQSFDCNSSHVAPAQYAIDATFGSSGLLYFGNDGGVWRTTDAVNQSQPQCSSDDASHFQNLNPAFTGSIARVENLAFYPSNPQTMMLSLGSLGTAAPTGAGSWQQVLNGEGDFAAIDPSNPQNWYATSEFGIGINRCTQGSSCGVSSFGSPIIDSADVGNDGYGQVIPAPWILDPQDSSNIILGTCRVWMGPATGGALTSVSPMLDSNNGPYCNGNAEIRSIAASGGASGAPERIYVGMAGLFDGGATEAGQVFEQTVTNGIPASSKWINLSDNTNNFNPNGFDISSIYVDPHSANGQTVYVTVQGFGSLHLYQTTDGGNTWNDVSSNLSNAPANSVAVDPNNANTVYIGTDAGVYYTQNIASCAQPGSNCWTTFGTSLPNAPVMQISAFNTPSGTALLAATYGRGVWQANLVTVTTTAATANPTSLTFPNQTVGTTSASQQVVVTNTGTLPLQVTSLGISGDFSETDTCAGQSIAPGNACVIEISFAPTQTGARTGVLTLYANLSGGGQLTIPLSGTGTQAADVTLTPTALCFQAALIGQTTSTPCGSGTPPSQSGSGSIQPGQSIVIANTGGTAATLSSVSITSGASDYKIVADTCGASLAPANTTGDSCTVSITFTPSASGSRAGALTVTGSAGTQTAQLSGTGQSQATDTLSPTSLSFNPAIVGTPSRSAQQLTVTMTNTGDQAVQSIVVQSSSAEFVATNNCGSILAGHASCAIVVSFVPTSVGPQSGTLSVSDTIAQGSSAISHTQQVALTGTGTAPAGAAFTSPSTINFGYFAVGSADPNIYTISVTNNGTTAIAGMQPSITGDFQIQTAASSPCGATLAIGASCNIAVEFVPTQVNQRTGVLSVSGTNLAPLSVALAGNGAAFQMSGPATALISGGQTSISVPISITSVNGSSGPVNLTCSVAPATATCSIPGSVTLTGLSSQSATLSFVIGAQSRAIGFTWKSATLALALLFPLGCIGARRRKWFAIAACVFAVLLLPVGCGVSSSSGGGTGSVGGGGGTTSPTGTYTVTVTGTMLANMQSGATTPGLSNTVTTQVTVE